MTQVSDPGTNELASVYDTTGTLQGVWGIDLYQVRMINNNQKNLWVGWVERSRETQQKLLGLGKVPQPNLRDNFYLLAFNFAGSLGNRFISSADD